MIPRKYILLPFLIIIAVITILFSFNSLAPGGVKLLNDRSGQIVGADLLNAPGFVIPYGLTGDGQVVAIADSGLDKGSMYDIHQDLASQPGKKPKVIMLRSFAGRQVANDPVGHGTHMAGTIAGNGSASGGKFKGLAPGSSIYFQGLLNQNGKLTTPSNLDNLFLPAYQAGARIHVNAWGNSGNTYSSVARKTDEFMRNFPNFLIIYGAGNSGPGEKTLTNEANSKNALVVGASLSPRPALDFTAGTTLDTARFSSRGPAGDGRIKPDLLAPGTSIISTRSSLVAGNLPGFPEYSIMQGTSMSSAVAAGSAALLREYLQKYEEIPDPMSATVKAALINGARTANTGPSKDGFGVLDLAGTVMALKENSMELIEENQGIPEGVTKKYTYKVENPDAPLKVTLAWNDPAWGDTEKSSTLVNDLNLTVTGPDGKIINGNHFLGEKADNINNVEQVYIKNPKIGNYIIEVEAQSINGYAVSSNAQDYSLVYGQPLATGIIKTAGNAIGLVDGHTIDSSGKAINYFLNGKSIRQMEILPGYRAYYNESSLYVAGRLWTPESVQAKDSIGGRVWHQLTQENQEGGYYQRIGDKGITVNNRYQEDISNLPQGIGLKASLDGVTQTISSLVTDYRVREGFVNKVNTDSNGNIQSVELIQSSLTHKVSPNAVYTYNDSYKYTDPLETVFGTGNMSGLVKLMPGQHVNLIASRTTNIISSILVDRTVVSGFIDSVDPLAGSISTGNEGPFKVLSGAEVQKDRVLSSLEDLQPGDYIVAAILPESSNILGLAAFSNVVYGKILFTNAKDNIIYINDTNNNFRELKLSPQTEIIRWGIKTLPDTLTSGTWIRATLSPGADQVWRVDVAELLEDETSTVNKVENGYLYTSGGGMYPISPNFTGIEKDGLPVTAGDLAKGEKVTVISLLAPAPYNKVPVAIRALSDESLEKPVIMAITREEKGKLYFTGFTTGDVLYAWHEDGQREEIPINAEITNFNWEINFKENEDTLKFVAIDKDSGAVSGKILERSTAGGRQFTDISGHWAEEIIKATAVGGIMAGNSDGTFRPDKEITIAELYRIRSNISGQPITELGSGDYISRKAFMLILRDIFGDVLPKKESPALPFTDIGSLSRDEREVLAWAYSWGIISGRTTDRFYPQRYLTRAETAAIIQNVFAKLANTETNNSEGNAK